MEKNKEIENIDAPDQHASFVEFYCSMVTMKTWFQKEKATLFKIPQLSHYRQVHVLKCNATV